MIKVGFRYYAKFAGMMKNGRFKFSLTDKDKETETPYYATVFCENDVVVNDGDNVKIVKIYGAEVRKNKKGELNHTLSCDVEIEGKAQATETQAPVEKPQEQTFSDSDFDTGPLLDISSDDLPF